MRRSVMIMALILATVQTIKAFDAQPLKVPEEYSPRNIKKFIRYLLTQGDYYRAYTELHHLELSYPGICSKDRIEVTKIHLLYKGGRFDEVIKAGKGAVPGSGSVLYAIDASLALMKYKDSYEIAASLQYTGIPLFDIALSKRKFAVSLLAGRTAEADETVKGMKVPLGSQCEMLKDYAVDELRKRKSPVAAAALGILPGMGYFYAGNRLTGLLAFIAITLNALVTYFAFETGNRAIGAVTGAVGAFLYTGSVVGGYLAARGYNSSLEMNINRHLMKELDFEGDREKINKDHGIENGDTE